MISFPGNWIATGTRDELRVWFFNSETQSFNLDLKVRDPHKNQDNELSTLIVRERGELEALLASSISGSDTEIKIWSKNLSLRGWGLEGSFAYKDQVPTNFDISRDLSTLAATYQR